MKVFSNTMLIVVIVNLVNHTIISLFNHILGTEVKNNKYESYESIDQIFIKILNF